MCQGHHRAGIISNRKNVLCCKEEKSWYFPSFPIQVNGASSDASECQVQNRKRVKRWFPTEDREKMVNSWLNDIMEAKNAIWDQKSTWKTLSKKNPSQPVTYKLLPLSWSSPMALLPVAKNMGLELLLPASLDLILSSRHLLLKAGRLAMCLCSGQEKPLFFSDYSSQQEAEYRPVLRGKLEKY